MSKKSLLSALCLHLVVLLGAGFYLTLMPFVECRPGEQAAHSVTSYLYQENSSAATEKMAVSQAEKLASPPMIMPKKERSPRKEKSQPQQRSALAKNDVLEAGAWVNSAATQQKNNTGKEVKTLAGFLHTAIQRQQQYPESALQMGRQGRAVVGFRLYPDGAMQGLQLIKSSGTDSLDVAALAAVRRVMPFKQASAYLSVAEDFRIDVVFVLDIETE